MKRLQFALITSDLDQRHQSLTAKVLMTAYCFAHQIEGITPLKRNSVVIPLIKGKDNRMAYNNLHHPNY